MRIDGVKITTRRIIIFVFMLAFGINLYFLVFSIYSDPQFNDREGLRPREGVSIGRNENINLGDIDFYIVNTRDTDSIEIRFHAKFLDPNSIGKIGIYFPYKVDMISNSSGWEKADIDSGTAFMKKYSCDKGKYCNTFFNEQPIFTLTPEHSKFDSKNRYKHGIKVTFDHTVPPDADGFFRDYNLQDNHPLEFRYDDSVQRQATIIIPEEADNIHPIPIPSPGVFHNPGIDYSNTQLDWHLITDNHAFFVDYEMPNERKQFETSRLYITLTGITISVIMGSFGIALAIERSIKKSLFKKLKWPNDHNEEK